MAKKTRAPGGGRKPLDPAGSHGVMIRMPPSLLRAVDRLAKRHRRDRSKEIRDALGHWVRRYQQPALHVGALTCLIEMLVGRIEQHTRKRWIDDPQTGAYVREGVERLIFHFAPTPAESVVVPPEVNEITGKLIALAELLHESGVLAPIRLGTFAGDLELSQIVRDLGSGWQRNRAAWGAKS